GQARRADGQPQLPPGRHHGRGERPGLPGRLARRAQPPGRPRAGPHQPRACGARRAAFATGHDAQRAAPAQRRRGAHDQRQPGQLRRQPAGAGPDTARTRQRRAEPPPGPAGAAYLPVHRPGAQGHQGRLPQYVPVHQGRARDEGHRAGRAAFRRKLDTRPRRAGRWALMLRTSTRVQLVVFALIAVLVMGYTAIRYANLGRVVGLRGYYVVQLELANGGGIFPQANVTYRGVSVGRGGAVRLTSTGGEADLNISNSAPPIPTDLQASVADLSAVGEQYVNLRPGTSSGPYLTQGSVIPRRDTELPLPVTSLLTSINQLATSVPLGSLRTVLNALATGFGGTSTSVQALIDGQHKLVLAAGAALPQTDTLIQDSQQVLATQNAEAAAFRSFAANTRLFAG